ncbi:MAG: response regulator, partial [Deltaproteobacteria bacterium]|nr:response regulator [Deltaproteobacteria bacterium]
MVKSIRDRMEYANSLKLGISDPFFTVDPEMNVAFINEAAARLAGLSREEAIGMPCCEVFHSSACEQKCPVKKALETDEVTVGQRITIKNRKGREIPAMSSSALLKDSSGKVLGGFEIFRDLTAEVEAEERLQDAYIREQKAKRAAENMSHEIRTPMNGVIAAAELALSEKMCPRAERYLEIIQSSAYSLLGIINDILDFSKIEADKLDIETHPFLLDGVIDRITDVFVTEAAGKRIELLVDIDLAAPNALIGDSLRLQQILKNLVSNAVKFTDVGGIILVRVTESEKSADQTTLTFSVKDTGIGIAPKYLSRLFKPFSQVDTSSTREYEGTGLGQKLVPPPDIQHLNVLVVDDCADSRLIMQKMLESFGLRVKSVSSGEESIEALKENETRKEPFELVVIDWLMPGLGGIETSKRIRKDLKLTIPIILMTAFGKETEILDA